MVFIYALLAVVLVSLLSLLGALILVIGRRVFDQLITYSVAVSSGVLLGSVFLDLLPESVELLEDRAFIWVLLGLVTFFAVEKLIQWHHHIESDHRGRGKPVAYLTLLGDGIHNFADGAVMAAAFLASVPLGVTTTLAVVAHEIPHELSDFLILLHGGLRPGKALFYNFLSATTAILGAVVVFGVAQGFSSIETYLVPFAAGNFIYIASSDLIPELLTKRRLATSLGQLICLAAGIFIIYFVKIALG